LSALLPKHVIHILGFPIGVLCYVCVGAAALPLCLGHPYKIPCRHPLYPKASQRAFDSLCFTVSFTGVRGRQSYLVELVDCQSDLVRLVDHVVNFSFFDWSIGLCFQDVSRFFNIILIEMVSNGTRPLMAFYEIRKE
jgi:hypothetical protein